jgi:hypothetical protein
MYTMSIMGILLEITALTLIQYLNFFAFQRSMNLIKTHLFQMRNGLNAICT